MKNECEIVKDLLPNYIEDLVSDETKKFINNHISSCADCKKILRNMQESDTKDDEELLREEEVEIRQIKKYKKKTTIVKISITSFLILILVVILSIIVIYIPKYSIISKTYNKIEELSKLNNYKATSYQYYIDETTQEKYEFTSNFFYKDGKYKEEKYSNISDKITKYGYTPDEVVYIDNGKKTISENTTSSYKNILETWGIFTDIYNYMENKLNIISLNIREDKFNNTNCYVLKFGNSDENYRELWINKDTMLPIREVQIKENEINFEGTFSVEINVVLDNDVDLNFKNLSSV